MDDGSRHSDSNDGVGDAERLDSTIDLPEGQKVYSVAHRPPLTKMTVEVVKRSCLYEEWTPDDPAFEM